MKEDYNKVPTFSQLIVIIFAVIGFLSTLLWITSCSPNSINIWGGAGESFSTSEQWERPKSAYGTFGADVGWLINRESNVYVDLNLQHRSMFEPETGCSGDLLKMDCGDNSIETRLRIKIK